MKSMGIKIIVAVALVVVVVAGIFLFGNGSNGNTMAGIDEKIQNNIQQISLLTAQSILQFQKIEEEQIRENFKLALDLIIEEKQRNREINILALELTNNLEELAKISIGLKDREVRSKIEEAIQYQIEAISHLLNYGSGVDIILEELSKKYESILENKNFQSKRDINQLIELIKKEIEVAGEKSKKFIEIFSNLNNE
jgi:hypothetical protein